MDTPSYRTTVAEQAAIHAAFCRWKKQGLVCSICCELAERMARAAAQTAKVA